MVMNISASAGLFGVLLTAEERVDIVTKFVLAALAINIVLNYFLITWIGLIGAAIATTVSLIFLHGGCGLLVKKHWD